MHKFLCADFVMLTFDKWLLMQFKRILDENREDSDTMRAWSSHLKQVHSELIRKATEMWQSYSPKVSYRYTLLS